jgi:D-psicose/D-tagatose/L-ribulose 3-epimerase
MTFAVDRSLLLEYAYDKLAYMSDDSFEQRAARLTKYGYDGVEIFGDPEGADFAATKAELKEYNLEALSVGTTYTAGRDIMVVDSAVRENNVQFTIENVEMAAELSADSVCLSTNPVRRSASNNPSRDHERMSDGLIRVVEYVDDRGLDLTL